MNKQVEWKRLSLDKTLDFSGALSSQLEHDGDQFISLTLKLKNGQLVRIRKNDYSVSVEAPVIPTEMKFMAKIGGVSQLFNTKEEAEKALEGFDDAQFEAVKVPKETKQLAETLDDLPF